MNQRLGESVGSRKPEIRLGYEIHSKKYLPWKLFYSNAKNKILSAKNEHNFSRNLKVYF